MPICGGILVAETAAHYLSSGAGMLRFLARLSGRRRHVRRNSGPGGGGDGGGGGEGGGGISGGSAILQEEEACCRGSSNRSHGVSIGDDVASCHQSHQHHQPHRQQTVSHTPNDPLERTTTITTTTFTATTTLTGTTADTSATTTATTTTTATAAMTRGCRIPPYLATLLIVTYTLFGIADACSSRSTPKPRPPTPTPRPNITFHMYICPPDYAEWYCLNGATCFTVKIVDSLLYNCLCANGYIGQRCEFKDLDGSYLPSRQRVMLETASIAGGATIAVFLVVIICIAAYIHFKRKQKELRTSSNCVDTVDGPNRDPELRPFSNRSRSLMIFMAKNPNSLVLSSSIEQTRMPGWNYPQPESTRMASINEGKRSSQ